MHVSVSYTNVDVLSHHCWLVLYNTEQGQCACLAACPAPHHFPHILSPNMLISTGMASVCVQMNSRGLVTMSLGLPETTGLLPIMMQM